MKHDLKILILEDEQNDADLLLRELKKSGLTFSAEFVETKEAFERALQDFGPDLILSDYSLPSFDGLTALQIKQNKYPDIPFIIVSGIIGEEKAVALIKAGVTDYVLKDKLFSLPQKITRALKEAEEKKEKRITDEKLRKANRLYAFISHVNQTIVRVKNETDLFRNCCNIAIESGKFKMAWFGFFDAEQKTISVVDHSGIPVNELDHFTNASCQNGGPQDHVLRTGNYYICNDVESDLELKDWKHFAAAHCIRSCIVLPVKKSGHISGTFNLCSEEQHFYDTEEISLLLEVTSDISFALNIFEKEIKHAQTEELLVNNEKRFRTMIEKGADMITLSAKNGKILYSSPSIIKLFGYSYKEIPQAFAFDFIHPDDTIEFAETRMKLAETPGKSIDFQRRLKHKNGTWIWCEGSITNLLHEPGIHAIVANFRDISERKMAEKQQEFNSNNLNALINNTKDLMWSVDRDFNLITSNFQFDEMVKYMSGKVIAKGSNVFSEGFSDEQLKHFKSSYERAFAGEAFTEIEYSSSPVDFWSEISYYP
ncbi:MAG: PAS domain S-box protein, partial [Bacteroidia bacterium]|nr:PAS domain S-box protein [Bacteroidia bacterium]